MATASQKKDEGTIPANTGRIEILAPAFDTTADHPREYGENLRNYQSIQVKKGPSPRIRGECLPVSVSSRWGRTIPANTGRISSV